MPMWVDEDRLTFVSPLLSSSRVFPPFIFVQLWRPRMAPWSHARVHGEWRCYLPLLLSHSATYDARTHHARGFASPAPIREHHVQFDSIRLVLLQMEGSSAEAHAEAEAKVSKLAQDAAQEALDAVKGDVDAKKLSSNGAPQLVIAFDMSPYPEAGCQGVLRVCGKTCPISGNKSRDTSNVTQHFSTSHW